MKNSIEIFKNRFWHVVFWHFLFSHLFAFALFMALTPQSCPAQDMNAAPMGSPDYRPLMIQGQIASIRIVPGEKSLKLFVLGKKALEAKPKSDFRPEVLRVTAFTKESQEELKLSPSGDYYTVTPPQWKDPYSLRIETKIDQQLEKLEIKIPRSQP
jgi:hypothetical protein